MQHKLKAFALKTYTFALSGLRINHGIVFIVSHIKLFNDMKNKHYFTLLFATLLSPIGAAATSWTPPTVTGQELKTGETQYAYNVKANGFLNANSTQTTVVTDEGLPLFITSSTINRYCLY